jgi:predicted metal-binding protein
MVLNKSMTPVTLFVCELCQSSTSLPQESHDNVSAGQSLIQNLKNDLAPVGDAVQLQPVRCMAGCSRACNVSLAAPDKLTFILSHVSPTDSAAIAEFCQQYAESSDGRVPYRSRSPIVQQSTVFVLPPLPVATVSDGQN